MKPLVMTALIATLGSISTTCLADGGNFFVNTDIGRSVYHVDFPASVPLGNSLNNSDTTGALRFGYRWHSVVDYGLEAGYVDLNQTHSTVYPSYGGEYQTNLKDRGWMLGGNLKYNINGNWYVSARGGWFRPQIQSKGTALIYPDCSRFEICPSIVQFDRYNYSQTVSGEYLGVGAGYDFSSNFSFGVSYDYYRSGRLDAASGIASRVSAGSYSLSAEYRF